MLQKIRANLQGVVAYVIVGFLIVIFALWGVEALFMGDSATEVAEVNGEAISELELNRQVYQQRQQLLARMGDQVDAEQIDEAMLRGPVLQQMINERLLQQSAEANDLVITEAMAHQFIQQRPEFQVEGVFSPERFDMLVRGVAMTPAMYRDTTIKQLQVNQLLTGLAGSEFITPRELELAVAIMGQKRDVETAILRVAGDSEHTVLEDGAAERYYQDHQDEFLSDEQVEVEYIEMRLEDFYPDVSEEDIAASYRASVDAMDAAERRRASHIMLDAETLSEAEAVETLNSLAARVAEGESFADLAAEYSTDLGSKTSGGDVGYTSGDAFPEAFEAALAALQEGEVSEPIRTDAGWHLIQLTALEKTEVPALADQRNTIREQLQREKAEPDYGVKLEELKDISFNAADLTSVAVALDLSVQTSEPFSRSGAIAGVFGDQRVIAEAFSDNVVKEGMNSEVVELDTGHAVVVRLAKRHQPEPIAFADVQAQIEQQLQEEKIAGYLRERADGIEAALAEGQALAELATGDDISYQSYEGLTRQEPATAGPEIVNAAFGMSPPGEEPSVVTESLSDGTVAVIVLNRVEPGTIDDFDQDRRDQMQRALSGYRSERVVEGYRSALQQEADIEVM